MPIAKKNFDTLNQPIDKLYKNKTPWIRNIKVVLSNEKGQSYIFKSGDPELNIDIQGTKNLALNKDKGIVTITNLPYTFLVKLINEQFYNIEIFAGYGRETEPERYFKGEVSYISQKIHSNHDVDTYINFASKYIAKFSQTRMNLTLNSGINIYAAVNYICQSAGINPDYVNVSESLRDSYLPYNIDLYDQPGNLIEQIVQYAGNDFSISTDSSSDSSFYIDCTRLGDKRRIYIDRNSVVIAKGNPTISSAGLKATLLPMINLMPGDIIHFPNDMVDASIASADVTNTRTTEFFDPYGWYMVRQIDYHFQNRGATFELNITAIAETKLKESIAEDNE